MIISPLIIASDKLWICPTPLEQGNLYDLMVKISLVLLSTFSFGLKTRNSSFTERSSSCSTLSIATAFI